MKKGTKKTVDRVIRKMHKVRKANKVLKEDFSKPMSCEDNVRSTPGVDNIIENSLMPSRKVVMNLWRERSEEFIIALIRRVNVEKNLLRGLIDGDNPKPGVDEAEMRGLIKGLNIVMDLYSSYFMSTGTHVENISLRHPFSRFGK